MKTLFAIILLAGFFTLEALAGFRHPMGDASVELARPTPAVLTSPRGAERILSAKPKPQPVIPKYNLRGWERSKILAFAKQARQMKIPLHEYSTEVKAKLLLKKYAAALQPIRHKTIRDPRKPELVKIKKFPPSEMESLEFEFLVRRMDSLFLLHENILADALAELWALAIDSKNLPDYQPRDALFAAIAAKRLGWTHASLMAMEYALQKQIELQQKYFSILWNEAGDLPAFYIPHITALVKGSFNDIILSNRNEATFFSYGKQRLQRNEILQPLLARLGDTEASQRLQLLSAIQSLQKKEHSIALEKLEHLAKSRFPLVKKEATHNLARLHLLKGNFQEASTLLKTVLLDSRNKVDVLLELAYSEWKAGNYPASLGKAIGLQSPYFLYAFLPDAPMLEAYNRKALCDFGGAMKAIHQLRENYSNELLALESLEKMQSKEELYSVLIRGAVQKTPLKHQRYLLHLPNANAYQTAINNISKEQIAISQHTQGKFAEIPKSSYWNKFLDDLDNFQAKNKYLWISNFEKIVRNEIPFLAEKIRRNLREAELLSLDISTGASDNHTLQAAFNYPVGKPAEAQPLDSFKKVRWPYEDEVWEDELQYLEVTNPTKCAKDQMAGA